MFSTRIDLTGKQFGYIKVNKYSHTKNKLAFWECTCVCGKEIICSGKLLRNGHVKSCGCMTNKMVSDAKIDNMKGKTIGRLTFKEYVGLVSHHAVWLCQCSCGNECLVKASSVKSGTTKSCGCLAHEVLMERNYKHDCAYLPIYRNYHNMLRRCFDERDKHYKYYGGRGITVCKEWSDKDNGFINFYNWALSSGYKEEILPNGKNKWTIDRINVNGNYEPSNCRWATNKQQANNKTTNIFVNFNGIRYTISELCETYNLKYPATLRRYHAGWSAQELVQGFRA